MAVELGARPPRERRPKAVVPAIERVGGWRKFGRYVLLAFVAFIVLAPIYAVLMQALKSGPDAIDHPRSLLPTDLTLDTIRKAWRIGDLGRLLANSLIMSVLVTAGVVLTSLLSAYAFAFLDFPGRRTLFALFLATLLVPTEVTVVVNQRTIDSFGWRNSFEGLVIPLLATGLGTFLIRQVFLTIPTELREAGALDGLGHMRFLWEVAAPLSRPTLGALGLLTFLGTWNQYLWPQAIITDNAHRTIQIGLNALTSADLDNFNLVTA
ncbi:MAG: ABC-type sugar transport system, permease component, partial [Ilumatobacteraceae bacterium]|nr:ABC-type sugar transport system, permease component [Ilumatobacteraceae bacterium]